MDQPNKNEDETCDNSPSCKNKHELSKEMKKSGYPLLTNHDKVRDMKSKQKSEKKDEDKTCYACTSCKRDEYETSHDVVNRMFYCSICHWKLVQTPCGFDALFKEEFS